VYPGGKNMETCRRWLHGRGELNWTLEQRDEKLRIFIICGLNPERTWGESRKVKRPQAGRRWSQYLCRLPSHFAPCLVFSWVRCQGNLQIVP